MPCTPLGGFLPFSPHSGWRGVECMFQNPDTICFENSPNNHPPPAAKVGVLFSRGPAAVRRHHAKGRGGAPRPGRGGERTELKPRRVGLLHSRRLRQHSLSHVTAAGGGEVGQPFRFKRCVVVQAALLLFLGGFLEPKPACIPRGSGLKGWGFRPMVGGDQTHKGTARTKAFSTVPRYPTCPLVHAYMPPLCTRPQNAPALAAPLPLILVRSFMRGPLSRCIRPSTYVYPPRSSANASVQARSELGDAYPTTPRVVASGEYLNLLGKQ